MIPFENNASSTIRNIGIVKGLAVKGHNIDIMTLCPNQKSVSYDESINDINGIVNKKYYIETDKYYNMLMAKKHIISDDSINSVDSVEKNGKSRFNFNIIKAVRNLMVKIYKNLFIFDAQKMNVKKVKKIKTDYNQYDVIISSSDPKSSHLIGAEIRKNNKTRRFKWIQYWGDPMLNDITRKKSWRDFIVKYYENKLIKQADSVIYASPLTLKIQQEIFPRYADKMNFVNQACISESEAGGLSGLPVKQQNDIVSIGYFGAYNSNVRNILPLYNAALKSNYKLNIYGSSDIDLKSTDNISVGDKITYYEALKKEMESDILICICNIKGTQIPGKIYYCASYKKPVIIILDGEYIDELKDYFNKFDRFILCENNEESIINAVNTAKEQLNLNMAYNIPKELTPDFIAGKILNSI